MRGAFLVRFFLCLIISGLCLYSYLEKQNDVTDLAMKIPEVSKELRAIKEENARIKYTIEKFESPEHLLALMNTCQFSYLKFPINSDVVVVSEGEALEMQKKEKNPLLSKPLFVIGAKP